MSKKVSNPVIPHALHLVFEYRCPECQRPTQALAQLHPGRAKCIGCKTIFPLMPIDARTVHFIHLILANGSAAVDPDFI